MDYWHEGREIVFVGVVPPGMPTAYGKSNYFSLALTILNTDTQDAFKEKIEGDKYFHDNEWKKLKIRKETILVKTSAGK